MSTAQAIQYDHDLSADDIIITPAAGEQLANLFTQVDDDDIQGIRVYVAGGGCSGMTYGMTYTDSRSPFDSMLSGEGYDLYVDAVALNYLRGVEIDFVERETGSTFVFNNVLPGRRHGARSGCTRGVFRRGVTGSRDRRWNPGGPG